jgi:hypothetical protein
MGSLNYAPLILKVDSDLRRFGKLTKFNNSQGAGTLSVVYSPPGRGKTTAVYAASVLLRDSFLPVVSVPPLLSLPLREIPRWLSEHLPKEASSRTTLALIDGRESTDDEQGLRDVMASLNNLVRGRSDFQFLWPTTDEGWRDRLVQMARDFGSLSFCPDLAAFSIDGPAKTQWVEAVSLILDQLNTNWDEFGINESTASQLVPKYRTLGEFFTGINQIRVDQEDLSDNITGLPEVVFVVSSHSQVIGHVARLRNPRTYRLRTDEVIGSARNSEAGKFWQARGATQKSNLAWVSSLLQVKLVALTPSTVAHAFGVELPSDSRVRRALNGLGFTPSRSSGKIAYSTTDLARFLAGEPVPEVLSSNKGKTSPSTLEAFNAIQALSSKQHRVINEAILSFVGRVDGLFEPSAVQYEVPLGDDAVVDAIVPVADRRLHLEFHHMSSGGCTPNKLPAI